MSVKVRHGGKECGSEIPLSELMDRNFRRQNMMIIFRITMLTLLLFVSAVTYGQTSNRSIDTIEKTDTKENRISFRKQKRLPATKEINQLKDGALLVRLRTKRNSITALRKIGKDKLAEKIETKQRRYNLKIVAAFKINFNFCPTYFYFSDYSQNVSERKFDKVIFLSDSLLPDTTIKFNQSHFLTAEFGAIEPDTAKYFSHYSYEPDGNWNLEQVSNYYCEPKVSSAALVIKSNRFVQLRRPFPYYVRTYDSLPIKRSPNKTVKRMNKKLCKFYNRWNR